MRIAMMIICGVLFVCWSAGRIVTGIQFDRNVGGYLALAASSNSIELADQEMKTALAAMNRYGYTSGFTSIIYTEPSEDVGFWFTNLKSAEAELAAVTPQTSPLERTNILLKLHETITAHAVASVFYPDGISIYPNNLLWALWGWGTIGIGCLCFLQE